MQIVRQKHITFLILSLDEACVHKFTVAYNVLLYGIIYILLEHMHIDGLFTYLEQTEMNSHKVWHRSAVDEEQNVIVSHTAKG